MPTLWGNHQPNDDDGIGRADDGREAADERTRLLSNHADRGPAMLAPDDPAVSLSIYFSRVLPRKKIPRQRRWSPPPPPPPKKRKTIKVNSNTRPCGE